jgi:uncharacterized protein (TIGR00296 family)
VLNLAVVSKDEGSVLVKAARASIELSIKSPKFKKDMVKDTIAHMKQFNSFQLRLIHQPTGTVRGSYISTEVKPLTHAIIDAAISASAEQSKPISIGELGETVVELHMLTPPLRISGSAEARKKSITLGKDGVIVKYGDRFSIMMPYEARSKQWEKEAFLQEACIRAGLPKNHWMQPNVDVYKFETQVFAEKEPDGSVQEVY